MAKLALTVGVNYPGTSSALQGCVPDAVDWQAALDARGFDTNTLHDGDATCGEILSELEDGLDACDRNSIFVFTFSGHGTRVPDWDGDEVDGWDEALVPADYQQSGMILDDDLYRLFAPADARGVRVVFIADSCFSGTLQRLAPPMVGGGPTGMALPDDERRRRQQATVLGYRRQRWLPPAQWMDPTDLRRAAPAWTAPRGKMRRSAVVMSACRDDQVTFDAYLGGRYRGAFTAAALTALADTAVDTDGGWNYRDWHRRIRTLLPSEDFDNEPQLGGAAAQKRWLTFEPQGRR